MLWALLAVVSLAASDIESWNGRYASAQAHFRQHDWDRAEKLLLPLLAEASDDKYRQAITLHLLGGIYQQTNRPALAKQQYRQAIECWGTHVARAASLMDLGYLLLAEREFAESEKLLLQSLELHRRVLGPKDEKVGVNLLRLGDLYLSWRRHSQARPRLEEALTILGAGSLRQYGLISLARLHALDSEDAKALALLTESDRTCQTPADCGSSLAERGGIYRLRGDAARARPVLKRALAMLEPVLGPDHQTVATVVFDLALVDLHDGKWQSAEQGLRESETRLHRTLAPNHPVFSIFPFHQARILLAKRRYAQAAALVNPVLPSLEENFGKEHPDVIGAHLVAALAAAAQGDDADAQRHYSALRTQIQPKDVRTFAGTLPDVPSTEAKRIGRFLKTLRD